VEADEFFVANVGPRFARAFGGRKPITEELRRSLPLSDYRYSVLLGLLRCDELVVGFLPCTAEEKVPLAIADAESSLPAAI
jgi:hypothetical protein